MAVYKLFPIQDASIYSFYPTMNTGIDPIIEVGNLNVNYNSLPQVFRFLIKFSQTEIEDIVDNKVGGVNFTSSLKCFIANTQGIISETEIEVYPAASIWNNGTGTYLDSPFTTNGVSWKYSDYENGTLWPTSGFGDYITASFTEKYTGGGIWFTGSSDPNNTLISVSQSFDLRTLKDINLDVSDILKVWYSSSNSIGGYTNISNNGFIIKWEDVVEFNENSAVQPIMQFYSVDTNTIYPPVLEIKWDDQVFETGSLSEISTSDIFVSLDSNPGIFNIDSVNRFRLNVREQYPARTFTTSSLYTSNKYLNSGSLYALKDLDTNEFIIDFDVNNTKISCDENGNYFDIYMNGLEPERNYKILIQTTISGSTIIKDDKYYFKVING